MKKYYYDFHIHSCLSPCGDNDMTPNNIVGVGLLVGLNVMALTDHNSCKNCPAFFAAAKKNGIVPVAGMELTTAEDIHVVCLFEHLADAMRFDAYIEEHRMHIPNNTAVYGEQLILDENDEPIGSEPYFLLPATEVSIDDAADVVAGFNGICYPAHVDREANGIIATLGVFPENEKFLCAEFYDADKQKEYFENYPPLRQKRILVSSDAHNLWSIREKNDHFALGEEEMNETDVRRAIFKLLRQK